MKILHWCYSDSEIFTVGDDIFEHVLNKFERYMEAVIYA